MCARETYILFKYTSYFRKIIRKLAMADQTKNIHLMKLKNVLTMDFYVLFEQLLTTFGNAGVT